MGKKEAKQSTGTNKARALASLKARHAAMVAEIQDEEAALSLKKAEAGALASVIGAEG